MKYNNLLRRTTSFTLLFVLYLCTSITMRVVAQETRNFTIGWQTPLVSTVDEITQHMPHFEGSVFSNGRIYFQHKEKVAPKSNYSIQIIDYQTIPADEREIKFIRENGIDIPNTLSYEGKTTKGAGNKYMILSVEPFIRQGNSIVKITSFAASFEHSVETINYQAKSFATQSVLRPGSGNWYKVAVNQDGIYKIDKAFLSSLGINVNSLNPQHINIYGNGDGRLPDRNDRPRTDDLAKNAIFIQGEGDGVFNDNDYILFYAKGPHRWDKSDTSNHFINIRHIYSDISCYFININPNEAPKRVQDLVTSNIPPTHTVSNYNFRHIIETDLINLSKSGQRWYGEEFDVELTRNFSISVPNPVPNAPSRAIISMGSDASDYNAGILNYTVNGNNLGFDTNPGNSSGGGRVTRFLNFNNSSSNVTFSINFQRSVPSVKSYLDRIEFNTRRNLVFTGNQFGFRDLNSVGPGNIAQYILEGLPSSGFVWDVSDRTNPQRIVGQVSGSQFTFTLEADSLREFVGSNGNIFFTPTALGQVNHQNLHALPQANYLIITHPDFTTQANRLAELHRNYNNQTVHVVNLYDIYNEFSSGMADAAAIRTFAKMFYDRSTNASDSLRYLCLFGDGTYDPKDRIQNNNNYIPTFQMVGGSTVESTQANIVVDDYYAILDDNETFGANDLPDIGVGRLLISDIQMAKEQVNKIEHYMLNGSNFFINNNINCIDGVSTSTFGDWRSKITNIADFEDYFIQTDLEPAYLEVKTNYPTINTNKLYADAYQVQTSAVGQRFPELNQALINSFYSGTLFMNYVGHGSTVQLSKAKFITTPIVQELRNSDRLPFFISATCEFTRFDEPSQISAGEYMSTNPLGGAIAMLTTTRTIYYHVNSSLNKSLYKNAFKRNSNFEPRTFGEIIMHTKVEAPLKSTDNHALTLIGDPALRLALPRYNIVIDSINGKNPAMDIDTLQALSRVKVHAHLEDFNGNILSNFNGVATPSLYDKPKQLSTMGQNPGPNYDDANPLAFELQKNVIYRGQSSVTNGRFSFEFIVPKDIDYSYGNGKFSLYANSNNTDAAGQDQRVIIGGVNPNGLNDQVGPLIKMYLNSDNFVNGGMTDETPYLIAKLEDENGINTVGNGIGHDITIVLDEETSNPIVVNEYFKNDLDSYKKGELRYQLTSLKPGRHTLTLKVWDVNNNSSSETIEFIVQEKQGLALRHVLNYPNPFTTSTEFYFEHNQCCTDLETQIQIFTVSGKLVKTINTNTYTTGYRSEGIHWDGRDDFGDEIGRGVYVYRIKVRTPDGEIAEKLEKLVLL